MTNEIKRITETVLNRLAPKRAVWFIKDTEQRGFQVKIMPSGHASYFVEARIAGVGKVKKFKIGNVGDMPLAQAREKARTALAQIRDGIDPKIERNRALFEGITLKELMERYLQSRKLKPLTVRDYHYFMGKQFSRWQNRRVVDITKHEILDWYQQGHETPTHTQGAYRALRALMNFAVGMEIIQQNPCESVKRVGVVYSIKKKNNHIAMHDLEKFLTVFIRYPYVRDSQLVARDVMLLMLLTGLRPNEAASLKWDSIDFERKRFVLTNTKNGTDHVIPMTSLSYALFRYRQAFAEQSPYVFRIKGKSKKGYITSYQKTLNNICDQAGIPRITPHDFRRTFSTLLNTLGIGFADVKLLMNHSVKDVTSAVYIQPDFRRMQGILHDVGAHYDSCVPYTNTPSTGFSRYAIGTLRSYLYGFGAPGIVKLKNPQDEDEVFQQMAERDYWEE